MCFLRWRSQCFSCWPASSSSIEIVKEAERNRLDAVIQALGFPKAPRLSGEKLYAYEHLFAVDEAVNLQLTVTGARSYTRMSTSLQSPNRSP